MPVPDIPISEYDYTLPEQLIAFNPLPERDASRLLVVNQNISDTTFDHIHLHLPENALMFFNNSRVLEARLLFQKPTGATIEIFCLEPDSRYSDIASALAQTQSVYWKCLVGNAASWTPGLILIKKENGNHLNAEMIAAQAGYYIIKLSWSPENLSFAEILHLTGAVPLPPYIKRKADTADASRYQTIYADQSGSVAAPTAGLHFTERVMDRLRNKKINIHYVTLHVGAGTFKPVKSTTIAGHEMHAEYIDVHRSVIESLLSAEAPVVAVGTTSLRTLESLYWIGCTLLNGHHLPQPPEVQQWMPYENGNEFTASESLKAILSWMDKTRTDTLITKTSLIIVPGYQFRIVSILVTNFHQPKSTLLLLIAAFIGTKWESAYAYALEKKFRFLSYGDSCLLFRQEPVPASGESPA